MLTFYRLDWYEVAFWALVFSAAFFMVFAAIWTIERRAWRAFIRAFRRKPPVRPTAHRLRVEPNRELERENRHLVRSLQEKSKRIEALERREKVASKEGEAKGLETAHWLAMEHGHVELAEQIARRRRAL